MTDLATSTPMNGLVVATGNVRDFARSARIAVHDPWER
jgi:hypothetical protein